MYGFTQYPGSNQVGEIEHRGNGQGITDPYQAYGDRYITPYPDTQQGAGDHLKGQGKKATKKTNKCSIRHGIAIDVPEVFFKDNLSKKPQSSDSS